MPSVPTPNYNRAWGTHTIGKRYLVGEKWLQEYNTLCLYRVFVARRRKGWTCLIGWILTIEVLNTQTIGPIASFVLSTDPSNEALVSSSTVPKQWPVLSGVEHDAVDSSTQERDRSSHLESPDANNCELGAKGTQRRFSWASSMELKRWVKLLNKFRVGMFQKVLKVIYVYLR